MKVLVYFLYCLIASLITFIMCDIFKSNYSMICYVNGFIFGFIGKIIFDKLSD